MNLVTRWRPPDDPLPPPGRLVITGAAGTIGKRAVAHFHGRLPLLLLDQHPEGEDAEEGEESVEWRHFDLADPTTLDGVLQAGDTVLHLAATPDAGAEWEPLLELNITGTYHMLHAAEQAGARRVIIASSIHAVSGHAHALQIRAEDPVCPGDLYGVSKVFGEALGQYLATQRGLPVIAVRIGAFQPPSAAEDPDRLAIAALFVSPRDLLQLFERAIDDRRLQFAIVHGVSGNRFNRLSLDATRQLLDYEPQDDFTEINPRFADVDLWEAIPPHTGRRS